MAQLCRRIPSANDYMSQDMAVKLAIKQFY